MSRRRRGGIDAVIEAFTYNPPAWYDHAECLGLPSEWWFPDGPGASLRQALAVCGQCPVADQCLDHALDTFENQGVWGGASALRRKELRRERRRPDQ